MKLSVLIPVYNQETLVIKALDALPRRADMEVLVCDDGSTDKTLANLEAYKDAHPDLNLRVFANDGNKGVACTKNRLLGKAHGEYFHIHDSDDSVITDAYSGLVDRLNGMDIYTMNLVVNSGAILSITPDTCNYYCAQIARFIRRDFAEGITFPEDVRAGDDWFFANALLERNPRTEYTGVAAYRYNFPREGSLCDLRAKGILP